MARIALFIIAAMMLAMIVPAWLLNWVAPDNATQTSPEMAETAQLQAAITPAAAPATASYTGRTVRLDMDARGHFYGDFRLNGRRVRALVDTGATTVAINASTARQIGLSLSESDFRYKVATANGETSAAIANITSVEIGRIRIDNVQAMVLEDSALSDTLLGMSFLKSLARFEISGDTLTLTQ